MFNSIESFLGTLANDIPVPLINAIGEAIKSGVSPDRIMSVVLATMTEAGRLQLAAEFGGGSPDELKDAKIERLRAERDAALASLKDTTPAVDTSSLAERDATAARLAKEQAEHDAAKEALEKANARVAMLESAVDELANEPADELKDAKIARLRSERDALQAKLDAAPTAGAARQLLAGEKAAHAETQADLQNAAARVAELEAEVAEHKKMLEELTAPAPNLTDSDPPPVAP